MNKNIKLLSCICDISYLKEKTERNDELKKLNLELIYTLSNYRGLDGMHLKYKDTNILVFRGTELCIKDILTDLRFLKKKPYYNKKIKVHSGFYKSYDCENTRINIQHHCKTLYKLNIIGHSLGGAVATLCAYDLAIKFPYININVVTFGCPRVGNKEFMNDYNSLKNITHSRIENEYDPITSLPYIGYYHVGVGMIYEDGEHEYIYNDNKSILNKWKFSEHSIQSYKNKF